MLRLVCIMAVTLLLSFAAAGSLPENASMALIGEGGVVVGVGEIQDGKLNLTLATEAQGFVTLIIEGQDGTVVSLEALLTAEGRVLIVTDTGVEDVFATLEETGGEVAVAFEERIAQGVEDVASLPEEAQAGMARAAENHAAARAKAEAARQNGAAGSDDAEEEDGDAGSDDAEEEDGDAEGDEPTEDDDDVEVEVGADVNLDVDTPAGGVSVGVGVGAGAN